MGEVHIVGEISYASDFPKKQLFCKWYLHIGNGWKIVSGQAEGQTQVDNPLYGNKSYWRYPIDIHLVTKTIQGWPKIHLQVFHFDSYGRAHLFGYGFLNIPTHPGEHNLTCYTWRPATTWSQKIVQYFLGGAPQLKHSDIIHSSINRYKLTTESMGTVHFQLTLVVRNFEKLGVEL